MAVRVWNQAVDPLGSFAGTLTCVARMAGDSNRLVALAPAHVVAPIAHPGTQGPRAGDQVAFQLNGRQLTGELWFWNDLQRIEDGFANSVDAALIDVTAADAAAMLDALQQPAVIGNPRSGSAVSFDGVRSGLVDGMLDVEHSTGPLLYPMLGGGFAGVSFKDMQRANMRALPGDSGAMLTSSGQAVGMLIGVEGDRSWLLPLDDVFDGFNLSWVPPNTPINNQASNPAQPLAQLYAPNPFAAEDTLARTLWGEARGEILKGIRAVAAVVLNRATHPTVHWWGSTIVDVCIAPYQFSCWNANDPNLAKLQAVTTADSGFQVCRQVAQDALAGRLRQDCTPGATHYHTKTSSPSWARDKVPCEDIGNHLFYNNIV